VKASILPAWQTVLVGVLLALAGAEAVGLESARAQHPRAARRAHRHTVRPAYACPPAHMYLYALSPDGAIYSSQTGEYGQQGSIYGCLAGTGRRFAVGSYLNSSQIQEGLAYAALRRPYAMVTQTQSGPTMLVSPTITVYDLRNGHRVRRVTPDFPSGCLRCSVSSAKLGRSADLAWTQENMDGSVSVVKVDTTGMATLDQGAIDPTSLALSDSGATVYWRDAGVAHSAALN
jgi:hypothetical protein